MPPSEDSLLEKGDDMPTSELANLPSWRKWVIVALLSWVALSATFASTSLLSVAREIAKELHTTPEAVNLSTAGLVFVTGFSSFIWSPVSKFLGFRVAYRSCIVVLVAFTIAAAVASTMTTFTVMRIMSGVCGTFFHVSGQIMLAELFQPTKRGTATGFFLCGTILGPPLGPCIAGVVSTFTTWRVMLWVQAGMSVLGLLMSFLVLPARPKACIEIPEEKSIQAIWKKLNPMPVFQVMKYPNVLLTHISCGLLSWSQYFLLSAPRQIISTQFGLDSPISSGLFYIAPATGFLLGTSIGGKYSDKVVRDWIVKRGGVRVPHDRLKSSLLASLVITPMASLLYGWGLQYFNLSHHRGGLAYPIVFALTIAMGLLMAFASLNTYCAEVLPNRRSDVVAGKYIIQYTFAATAIAGAVPLVKQVDIGVGSTISAIFVMLAGCLTWTTSRYGAQMQQWAEKTEIGKADDGSTIVGNTEFEDVEVEDN